MCASSCTFRSPNNLNLSLIIKLTNWLQSKPLMSTLFFLFSKVNPHICLIMHISLLQINKIISKKMIWTDVVVLQGHTTNIWMWFKKLQQRYHGEISQVIILHIFLELHDDIRWITFIFHQRWNKFLSTDNKATLSPHSIDYNVIQQQQQQNIRLMSFLWHNPGRSVPEG